jgi:putative phosphoesterase
MFEGPGNRSDQDRAKAQPQGCTKLSGDLRILALYDIHGNADALEAVLADPRASGPDAIVVGGDIVPGAYADAALDRLESLGADMHWVRGNGERETAAAVNGPPPAEHDDAAEMAAFTAQQLGRERALALGELPLSVVLDGVLFCHATPRSDEELVTRISPPERWSEVLADVDAALVVAGHTHQQDERVVNDVRFVNAGSVGLPYEGDGDARWLWIDDGVPELRRTSYDAAAAGRRMRDVCPGLAESVTASLIEPIEALVVTRMFEQRAVSAPRPPESASRP